MAGKRVGNQGHTVRLSRKDTHRVKAGRLRQNTGAGDQAESRLEPRDPAKRCRPDDGAARLCSNGKRDHAIGHCGSRPG